MAAITDNFNYANGALDVAKWESCGTIAQPTVSTNTVVGSSSVTTAARILSSLGISSGDHYSQAKLTSWSGTNPPRPSITVRSSGSSTTFTGYILLMDHFDDGNTIFYNFITLYRVIGPSFTSLGTWGSDGANVGSVGDTLRLDIVGYTLNVKVNGTSVGTYTDTSGSKIASGQPGTYFEPGGSGSASLDDFQADSIGSTSLGQIPGFASGFADGFSRGER